MPSDIDAATCLRSGACDPTSHPSSGDDASSGDASSGDGGGSPCTDPVRCGGAVSALYAGPYHACALFGDGRFKCWGENSNGQLGVGPDPSATGIWGDDTHEMGANLPFVPVGPGSVKVVELALGADFTCARSDVGNVYCWGSALETSPPQLGRGASPSAGATNARVDLGAGVTATRIFAGASHACALLSGGQVKCWGKNNSGQLGLDSVASVGAATTSDVANAPVVIGLPFAASSGALGGATSCFYGGTSSEYWLRCWGNNGRGQLGRDNTINAGDTSGSMQALSNVALVGLTTSLALGRQHVCALRADKEVKCWGDNTAGQLGAEETHPTLGGGGGGAPFTQLNFITPFLQRSVMALTAGGNTSCALFDDNTAKCWGDNQRGQLGQGDTLSRGRDTGSMMFSPINVGVPVRAIASGDRFTCALGSDSKVRCWGYGPYLGRGDVQPASGPGTGADIGNEPNEMGSALTPVPL